MRNLKLILAYDGSEYAGWQVQPDRETIQGTLATAIGRLTGENVLPQGSGRTDAGVHALAQVATFGTESVIPVENFQRALNGMLPAAIRVMDVCEVPADFHARKSARGKTYRYRMYRGEVCSPFVARYVWHYPYPLDEAVMMRAAAEVVGELDFTSFAAVDAEKSSAQWPVASPQYLGCAPVRVPSGQSREREVQKNLNHQGHEEHEGSAEKSSGQWPVARSRHEADAPVPGPGGEPQEREKQRKSLNQEGHQGHEGNQGGAASNVRRILESSWERIGEEFVYTVRGNGFLHHMVRNLVGTFLLVGKGALLVEDIGRILEARNRSAAGATAPAAGLCLVGVEYE